MSASAIRDFAALYEHIGFDIKCSQCDRCCQNVPYLTGQEKTSIARVHGDQVIDGNNLARGADGYCIFHSVDDGVAKCGLHGSCKPTSCQAFFCKGLLQEKYGLDDKEYDDFISYCRRTLRIELYGEEGIGYD